MTTRPASPDWSALKDACLTAGTRLDADVVTGAAVFVDLDTVPANGLRFQLTGTAPHFNKTHRAALTEGAAERQPEPVSIATHVDRTGHALRVSQGRRAITVPPLYNPLLAEALRTLLGGPADRPQTGTVLLCHETGSGDCHGYAFHLNDPGEDLQVTSGRWTTGQNHVNVLKTVTVDLSDTRLDAALRSVTERLAGRTGAPVWSEYGAGNAALLDDVTQMITDLNRRISRHGPAAPYTVQFQSGSGDRGVCLNAERVSRGQFRFPGARSHPLRVRSLLSAEQRSGTDRSLLLTAEREDRTVTFLHVPGELTLLLDRVLRDWTENEVEPGSRLSDTSLSYAQTNPAGPAGLTFFPRPYGALQIEVLRSTDTFILNVDQTAALKSAVHATSRAYLQDLAHAE